MNMLNILVFRAGLGSGTKSVYVFDVYKRILMTCKHHLIGVYINTVVYDSCL